MTFGDFVFQKLTFGDKKESCGRNLFYHHHNQTIEVGIGKTFNLVLGF